MSAVTMANRATLLAGTPAELADPTAHRHVIMPVRQPA